VRHLKLLVLVGIPGSGKSTFAERMSSSGWAVVNQDTTGTREGCVKAVRRHLQAGRKVVVDRCNFDPSQREPWLKILRETAPGASSGGSGAGALWLDVPMNICINRVLRRPYHPTLPPTQKSVFIVHSFSRTFVPPAAEEGFDFVWRVTSSDDLEAAAAALLDG
ncbi:unnamed protein product, partial [Phaeothamnion confervicola]